MDLFSLVILWLFGIPVKHVAISVVLEGRKEPSSQPESSWKIILDTKKL